MTVPTIRRRFPNPRRAPLSPSELAGLGLAVFFASGGVVLFVSTLPPGVAFCGGVGWAWAMGRVLRWADGA